MIKFLNRFPQIVVLVSFIFAFVLQTLPIPPAWQGLRPAWLVLMLLYWIMLNPEKINIGVAFLVGLGWDYVTSSRLGMHGFALVIVAYIACIYHQTFRNLSSVLQGCFVAVLVFGVNLCIFLLEYVVYHTYFYWQSIIGAIITGILWPWFQLFSHRFNPILRNF